MTLIVLLIRNSDDEEEEGDQVAWIYELFLFIADKDYDNMKNSIQNTYNLNVTTDQ